MIYLDYHASCPCDPRVLRVMMPYFDSIYGNPSSSHSMGEEARGAVEDARSKVAEIINADSLDIYFTSSATEANNIIIQSWYKMCKRKKSCIITTNSEHSSVHECVNNKPRNVKKKIIKINCDGTLPMDKLEAAISEESHNHTLVSIIFANNEIGTIHDIEKIGKLCKRYGVFFHTDATQAIGKVPIDAMKNNLSALTMSGHKIYGPKGVGALYVKDTSVIKPILHGGYQNILSSGTINVPAVIGMGEACRLCKEHLNKQNTISDLRDAMLDMLFDGLPDITINGTMDSRLPNNINITIPGVPAEILMKGMSNVVISGGSACASGLIDPSRIIVAIGSEYPECAVRISVGRFTTMKEIETASREIIKTCKEFLK